MGELDELVREKGRESGSQGERREALKCPGIQGEGSEGEGSAEQKDEARRDAARRGGRKEGRRVRGEGGSEGARERAKEGMGRKEACMQERGAERVLLVATQCACRRRRRQSP